LIRTISHSGWSTTAIKTVFGCFLANNAVMGIAFGSFGPLLIANEAHLGVGRGTAAIGMSLITISAALVAAVTGGMMQRFRARDVMVGGVVLNAIAYFLLAFTDSFTLFLCSYTLVGAGAALSGILTPLTLVSRWVPQQRGKALSAVNIPVVMFACPFLVGAALPEIGRAALLMIFACLFVALVPLLFLLVKERPAPSAEGVLPVELAIANDGESAKRDILGIAPFWLISLGVGILAGCGTVFVVHIAPFGGTMGLSAITATALLSIYAGAGLIGTPLFGWAADRYRPANALVMCSGIQALLWLMLLMVDGPILLIVAALMGVCSTPLVALHGAALSFYFDAATVARAMGYSYIFKMPMAFALAPVAGALFEVTGDYRLPFLLCSMLTTGAALGFLGLAMRKNRHAPS